jgi:DNA polymerase II large subunit
MINKEDLYYLRTYLLQNITTESGFELLYDCRIKKILETLLVPHKLIENKIDLKNIGFILDACLALRKRYAQTKDEKTLDMVNKLAGFNIREKFPIFVGARMGRPEKAKERKMSPYIHCLFPIGEEGGSQRNILKAKENQSTKVELIQLICPGCGLVSQSMLCPDCGTLTIEKGRCIRCNIEYDDDKCPNCGASIVTYDKVNLNLKEILEKARKKIDLYLPDRIKCVKRLMNKKRIPENLAKGILRAHFDLSVFKDGTLRFDATDLPLTHFTPSEIGLTIKELRDLGYRHDFDGMPLENIDQTLELKIQDVILPANCGDYLIKATKFIDLELAKFYKLKPYYNVKNRKDLIGEIILGLAPHTSAAIVGRILGFTNVRNCYAHPYWHAGKRRNCDGDEDSIMLVLDALLNFSRSFLPEHAGGLMDAPILIIPTLNPGEVDREAHNVDIMSQYPPEFYKLANEYAPPSKYHLLLETLGNRLGTPSQYQGTSYTERCSNINLGSHYGAYTTLHSMLEKLESQLELTKKLTSVDTKIVALKILNSHFMKDIIGNLRAFTHQGFRCVKCNKKYRRPLLTGKCSRCGNKIILTVHRGNIEKYLEPAKKLVHDYNLGKYYEDRLTLIKEEINTLFTEEEPKNEDKPTYKLIDFIT